MNPSPSPIIEAAELVLPCAELDATLAFFIDTLGFRLECIFPADGPDTAVISAHGVRLRLQVGADGDPGCLRMLCRDPAKIAELPGLAPNGTRIEWAEADPHIRLPPLQQSLVITRLSESANWDQGRAGMCYRDLIPDRQGGCFIASHIRIETAGPVPDYVHFHKIRFQMIYCYKGWVRVVYEDQGPPFVLQAGDCVLQPPQIRHRVLECSAGLEVIEISSPAQHETFAEHLIELPNGRQIDREYSGQRFIRHRAERADWLPWRLEGFEARDLLGQATGGLAHAKVARPLNPVAATTQTHTDELRFVFVLAGAIDFECAGEKPRQLLAGDSLVVPAGLSHSLARPSNELELLEVTLPAGVRDAG